MTDIDSDFVVSKNLADPGVQNAVKAKGPVRVVESADPGRNRVQTFGVFDLGNGRTFTDRIADEPLDVKIEPLGIADDEQAFEEAEKRGLVADTVRVDDRGRFFAKDAGGNEFVIGRRLRADELPKTAAETDADGRREDVAEAPSGLSEAEFQALTPAQRMRATASGAGRGGALPRATEEGAAAAERAAETGSTVVNNIFEIATGLERGVNLGLLETAKTLGLVDDDDAKALIDRFDRLSAAPVTSTPAGEVAETAGRIIGPGAPVFRVLTAAGLGPLAAAVVADGLGSAFGLDPNDPNLAAMLPEDSEDAFVSGLRDLLATDPDDPEWANRARNFTENLGIPAAFIATLKAVAKVSRATPDQVRRLATQAAATTAVAATAAPSEAEGGVTTEIVAGLRRGRRAARTPPTPAGPLADPSAGPVTIRPAAEGEARAFLSNVGLQDAVKGVDFNFDNITSTDSLRQALNQVSDIVAPAIDAAKRGRIKRAVTKDMADRLDMLPKVLTRKSGELLNAEQMVAARVLLADSAKRLDELAAKAASATASDIDLLTFRRQMALHAAIQMQVKGAQTEIARALSSFNIPVGPEGRLDEGLITAVIDDFGGPRTTKRMAERYLQIEDEAARNKFAFGAWTARAQDAFFEIWINGLLSGPFTHVRNTVGNALFQAWSIPENAIAATIGGARQATARLAGRGPVDDRVFAIDVAARLYGSIEGFKDGLSAFAKAMRTGVPRDPLSKIEAQRHRAISADTFGLTGPTGKAVDYLGAVIRLPGRFLMAEDEFFKAVAGRMEINQLAARRAMQARLGGATEAEAGDIAMETLRDPPPGVMKSVEDAQRYYTFTDEPTGRVNEALVALQKIPMAGRVVMPFRRTPLNILRRFGERSPFAAMMPRVWSNMRAGGVARDMAIARVTLGSLVMGVAASWAADGTITGRGPLDPKQRRQLRETGWQPWSIKVPKTGGWVSKATLATLKSIGAVRESADSIYISYLGIEPIGMMLATSAGTVDALKWSDEFNRNQDLATVAVASTVEAIADRSFMTGVAQLSDALKFGPNAFNRYISNLAASMKPNSAALRQINRLSDHTLRDTRVDPDLPLGISQFWAFRNGWIRDTPGLSTDLPPIRNLWGDEVKLGQGKWVDHVNPFYISPRKYAPVDVEMVRLGSPVQLPERRIAAVRLDARQYSRLVELQGKGVVIDGMTQKEAMQRTINSTFYIDATDDQKTQMIRNVHADYLDEARRQLAGYSVAIVKGRPFPRVDLGVAEDPELAVKLQQALDLEKELPPRTLPRF